MKSRLFSSTKTGSCFYWSVLKSMTSRPVIDRCPLYQLTSSEVGATGIEPPSAGAAACSTDHSDDSFEDRFGGGRGGPPPP